MYVDILFALIKAIPIMFEGVTTYYQTLKTWIGHNATRHHKFYALAPMLPHLSSQFNMDRPSCNMFDIR